MTRILTQFSGTGSGLVPTAVASPDTGAFDITINNDTTVVIWEGNSDSTLENIIGGALSGQTLNIINAAPNNNSLLTISATGNIIINSLSGVNSSANKVYLARHDSITAVRLGASWLISKELAPNILIKDDQNLQGITPWWTSSGTTGTQNMSSAVNAYIWAVRLDVPLAVRRCAFEIVTAAANIECQIRIYADNSTAVGPGFVLGQTLAISELANASTTGFKDVGFLNPIVLPRGTYWFAIFRTTGGPSIAFRSLSTSSNIGMPSLLGSVASFAFSYAFGMPTEFNNPTYLEGVEFTSRSLINLPRIAFRAG